jgi:secreted trypsin-like serine protease
MLALTVAAMVPVASSLSIYGRQSIRMSMRIINGTEVKKQSPYHVEFALPTSSSDTDSWLGCGASIISPTFALSSAHCFGGGEDPCSGPTSIALWVGDVRLVDNTVTPSDGGQSHRVEAELVCNKKFDGHCSHGNDIALLKLKEPLPEWVKPVKLNLDSKPNVGDTVTPLGFGMMEGTTDITRVADSSPVLRQVDITVMENDDENCKRMWKGGYGCSDEFSKGEAKNLDMQLCAGSVEGVDHDACAGDSGSPVMDSQGNQVGMVSYGGGPGEKRSGPGRMCGDPHYPGVYAQVSAFKSFILEHVTDLPQ